MVGTAELESATSCMSSKRSNQLSYAPAKLFYDTLNGVYLSSETPDLFTKNPRVSCAGSEIYLFMLRIVLRKRVYSYISVLVLRLKSVSISFLQRIASSPSP